MKRLSILLFFISLMVPGTCMAQQCSEDQLARLTMPMVGGSVPAASPAVDFPTIAVLDDFTCSSVENPPDGWSQYSAGIKTDSDTDDVLGADIDGGTIYKTSLSIGLISTPGIEAFLTVNNVDGGNANVLLLDSGNEGYSINISISENLIKVYKYIDGAYSSTIVSESVTWANGYAGGMRIVGSGANNLVSVYKRISGTWSQVGSTYTDTTPTTQGTIVTVMLALSNNTSHYDDIGAGTVIP